MSITFRVGKYIDPSGFGLAVVDIPDIDPEKNISLLDTSHIWEENVASAEQTIIKSEVDNGGHMPRMTITDFLVTNFVTTSTNDISEAPLWYRHRCRFYHYTYGETPGRQVYITDRDGQILKDLNYIVRVERISENVYITEVLTDFENNDYAIYKVKYNRCSRDGSSIYPGWEETLNAMPIFTEGAPFTHKFEYSIWGPDEGSLWAAVVPPVPTISQLVNSVGVSFEHSPTVVDTDVTNNVSQYASKVVVKYTLKASGPSLFTIQRNYTRDGSPSSDYLQSDISDTWAAAPHNFSIGTKITGLCGITLWVHGDNYLNTGDEAYFTAKKSYYYLMPKAYSSIYLKKPEHVTSSDDWYIRVKHGRFRRRMDSTGNVVPSGYPGSILWEYTVPEYNYQMWNLDWGPPYKESLNERVELLDRQTIQLQRTPLFIDPSSVLYDPNYPGFPPTGYLRVYVNGALISPAGVIDWDLNNGTAKLNQSLTHRDDITASYSYKEEFFDYTGFFGSGNIYPDNPPFPWFDLDLNPTPSHNYGMYASGVVAHIFLKPYMKSEYLVGSTYGPPVVVCSESLYHNTTGVPSGVLDFKLGTLSLGPHCKINDIKVTDVRVRGGGLSKLGISNLEEVKVVQPESEFFWDVGYFDGQAVPSNGTLVVRVPKRVLKSNGGRFEEDEVRQKVLKHLALGEYPIIEYV